MSPRPLWPGETKRLFRETSREERGGTAVFASYTFTLHAHILSSHGPMEINKVLNVLTIYPFRVHNVSPMPKIYLHRYHFKY